MTAFSDFHPFSRAQVEDAIAVTQEQGKRSHLLLRVTTAHRLLAGRQWWVQQVAYWCTVLGLVAAEMSSSHISTDRMQVWLAVSLVSWIVRLGLFIPLYLLPPATVARSITLKLFPVLISVIGCCYWAWTISLFVGSALSVRELFMCVGFLSISISMTGLWPVTPAPTLAYNVFLWSFFSYVLYRNGIASLPVLLVLNLGVALVLWLNVFISINQIRHQLERSDKMDILLVQLNETNAELQALKNAADSTLAARSSFFAEASHDLRQRLHAVKLHVLEANASKASEVSRSATLDRLGQQIDLLHVYMGDVLNLARWESAPMVSELVSTKIQPTFQKLDVQFEGTARSYGVRLHFRPTHLSIDTDEAMLHRMLENLISNALKFSRGGVLVCARRKAMGVAIEVWDQGPGIRPALRERIFEAFQQGEHDKNARGQGVGLGLAIVKRFADRMGYHIEVRSSVGRGSVFRVWIPTLNVRAST